MAKKSDGSDFRTIAESIRKCKFAPIYILMGEETYYLDVLSDMLEKTVVSDDDRDFNAMIYYGAECDIEDVAISAREFPMMSDRRLVMLKELQAMNAAKQKFEKLEGYFAKPSPATVLVVIYKGGVIDANSKAMKAAIKAGAIVFRSPKLREYQLAGPIKDYCASKRVGIDDKALELIVEHTGADLAKLFGEIDKILIASGGEVKRISADLIETNTGISKEYNNFELTSALALKDYAKSMKIVKYMSLNPKTNPTVLTTSTLFNFFTRLLIANFASDRSDSGLMKALQLKTPYALREIRTGMQAYNSMQCIKAISALREFDCKSKGINSFGNEYMLLKDLIFKIMTV